MKISKFMIFSTMLLAGMAAFADQYYPEHMDTTGQTFTEYTVFQNGWTSVNDTFTGYNLSMNANKAPSGERPQYDITGLNLQQTGTPRSYGVDIKGGVDATIKNSTLNIVGRLNIWNGSSNVSLINTNTTINSGSSANQIIDGSSLTVDGGSFTVKSDGSSNFYIKTGNSLTLQNTTADFTGTNLATRTDTSLENATAAININNSTFTAGYVELDNSSKTGSTVKLNISNGSNVTMALSKTVTRYDYDFDENDNLIEIPYEETLGGLNGAIVNVSGQNTVLNLTSGILQEDNAAIASSFTVSDGAKAIVSGDINMAEVFLGANASIEANNITANDLTVTSGASITLGEGGAISYENLMLVVSEDFAEGDSFDLNAILGEDLTIVASSLSEGDHFVVQGSNGQFNATMGADFATIGSVIPEPSAYAAIFGALALGFVAYRRRK